MRRLSMPNARHVGAGLALAALALTACVPETPPVDPGSWPDFESPLNVTTTVDEFDGECSIDHCSLRDALHVVSAAPATTPQLVRVISIPGGDYVLPFSTPTTFTEPVRIEGSYSTPTNIVLNPSGSGADPTLFVADAALSIQRLNISHAPGTRPSTLIECTPGATAADARAALVSTTTVTGNGVVARGCVTAFLGSTVTGGSAVIDPVGFGATQSRLSQRTTTLNGVAFNIDRSVLFGEGDAPTLTVRPSEGRFAQAPNVGESRFQGIGLDFTGAPTDTLTIRDSSFALTSRGGAGLAVSTGAGSNASVFHSSVTGGGTTGALQAHGRLDVRSSTLVTSGPAIAARGGSAVTARTSVLAGANGVACSGTVASLAHNAVVGSGCTPSSGTDKRLASIAALKLSAPDNAGRWGPTLHAVPLPGSPLIDAIAPAPSADDLNCPTDGGSAGLLDPLGGLRPTGAGCDIGATERT